jgi:hypothetical protein
LRNNKRTMEYIENKALYEHLTHYPINTTILYNALPTKDRPTPDLPRRFAPITNGDVIYHNLMSIRPNVDMVLYNNSRTDDEIREWIQTSRTYITNLAQTYNNLCDNEERHLNHTIDQRAKCASVRLDFIGMLPLDVIRHIKQFLLPEIQTQLYISCYPNLNEMLSKLTVDRLKTYYKKHVIPKFYNHFLTTPWKRWIHTNSLKPNEIRMSPSTKPEYIAEIRKILNMLHNVIPHTPEIHRYCQMHALTLIMSMIYTAKRFAPKPAKVKPPPKPKASAKTKKNTKKTAAMLAQAQAEAEAEAQAQEDELVNAFIQAENSPPTHM